MQMFTGCDDGQVTRLLHRTGLMVDMEVGRMSGLPYNPFVTYTSVSNSIVICNLIKVAQLVTKYLN